MSDMVDALVIVGFLLIELLFWLGVNGTLDRWLGNNDC